REEVIMSRTIHSRHVHMENAQARMQKYADGSTALVAESVDEDGMPDIETMSTNLSFYGLNPPDGHVYIKDYSEHEGLAIELSERGMVEIIEPIRFGPFGHGYLVKVTLTPEEMGE